MIENNRIMQRVVITGGNKGIGLETTKLFLKSNYEVIVVARDFSNFPLKNSRIKQKPFDLIEISRIPQLADEIGDIDILINNAGIMNSLPYDNYPENKKEDILKINLEVPVALITSFSKGMIAKGKGRIVNVASIAGEIGHPDVWYGITKAGIINLTKSFAKALGAKGIVINCVAPSVVETDMLNVIPEARREAILKNVVLGRFAKSQEVAETIYWLAIDSPEYINGICIDINNTAFFR